MGTRPTFAEICAATRDTCSVTLFEKARLSNLVAKVATTHGRRAAYSLKHRFLEAAMQLNPLRFRLRSDHACRRWIVSCRDFGSLHWRKLGDAV